MKKITEIISKAKKAEEFEAESVYCRAIPYYKVKINGNTFSTNPRSSDKVDTLNYKYFRFELHQMKRSGLYFMLIITFNEEYYYVKITPCTEEEFYELKYSKKISGRTMSDERCKEIAKQYFEKKLKNNFNGWDNWLWSIDYMTEEEKPEDIDKAYPNHIYIDYLYNKMCSNCFKK